ncbi:MAG: MazG-like family protein [Minisyncoccia bacterium]
MIDLKELQKKIMDNRAEKGFPNEVTYDFCRAYEELAEAFSKYDRNKPGVAEELADVMIFVLGLSHNLGFDLEKELTDKIEINRKRKYKKEKTPEGRDIFIRIKTPEDP